MPLQRLEALPTEVILSITTHITSHKDRFGFARCCHRLFDIVYPCTFCSIELAEYCTSDLSWLIHFLLHHQNARRSVESLILGRPVSCSKKHVHSNDLPTTDAKIVAEVNELVNYFTGWTNWRKELQNRNNCDAWLAFLLYILPNLRSIKWVWKESRTRYAAKLVDEVILRRDQFMGSGPLGKLEKVLLKGTGRREGMIGLKKILPFVYLPSLRMFSAQLVKDFDRVLPEMKNGASSVTHLELRQSITRTGFERLIRLCTGLKSFKYYYEPGPFTFERTATVIAHLQMRKDTLETLCLDSDSYSMLQGFERQHQWVGSLREFRKLRNLQLQMVHFFHHDQHLPPRRLVDLLPSSLETLCISGWWRENETIMLAEMTDLVHARDEFPHLSEMTIQGRFLTKILSPGEIMNYQTWTRPLPIIDGRTMEDSILEVTAPLRSSCEQNCVSFFIKDYEVEARAQGHKDPPVQDLLPLFRQGSSIWI
ncbi:hypothetical protein Aspvir_001795 [Aspergillus viridinutans]|uniref:Leucine-rich repeat domain-containing protein n=1 Tax=Aspergillus viridinutans TaxID=75553 RepID=A0A9P3C5A6_ASPVI|nr:uncharacterized protein Aspvir_001795 [Aspergillus viridinutans]GIK06152.1 hypothetical protein Aspvir_001795 [Aspergillus viridinutans]